MESSNVEDSLIAICRHSIRVNQCFGHIPVTMLKESHDEKGLIVVIRRKLTFKVPSVPYLVSLFFALGWILSLVQSMYWALSQDPKTKLQGFENTTTGSWSSYLTGYVLTTSVVLQRTYGLFFTKTHILKIWNEMVRKLDEISNSCPFGSFKISLQDSKYCEVYRKLSFRIRRTAQVHFVVPAGHFFVSSIVFILRSFEFFEQVNIFPTLEEPSVLFYLVSHSWTWFALMHFAIFSWVTLPIELAQGCLNMISRELAEIRVMKYNEKSLDTCIQNYHRVKSLIHFYSDHFGMRLIFDITTCAVLLLGNTFVMILLTLHKKGQNAHFYFLVSAMSLKVLHSLGSAAGDLTIECDNILDELCQFPLHLLSAELKEKVLI
jgi:hypothetical protein